MGSKRKRLRRKRNHCRMRRSRGHQRYGNHRPFGSETKLSGIMLNILLFNNVKLESNIRFIYVDKIRVDVSGQRIRETDAKLC